MNQLRTARDRLDRALSILLRTRRFIVPALVCMMLGTMASVTYAMLRKRVWKSETLILYREGIKPTDIVGGDDDPGDRAQKLGLRFKEMVLSRTHLEQIIHDDKLYPEMVEERGMIDAVDEMRKHIGFRVQDGDTFGLSFEGPDPKLVQKVTAQLADALIAENSRTHAEAAEVTKEFLDRERQRIETELKDKETALAQFLAKHPEFARETATPGQSQAGSAVRAEAARSAANAAKVDPTLASLEREAARLQERLGMPVSHHKTVEADPMLVAAKQDAENDVRQAQKDLADKQAQFTEEHPDVRAARARLRMAQDKLKRANEAIAANIAAQQQRSSAKQEDEGYIDRGALQNQLQKINEEIVEYKRRRAQSPAATGIVTSVVALETEWTRLNREVADARDRFQSLQDKDFKAQIVESAATTGRTAQMVVVDPAFLPIHAAKPGRTTIVAGGMAAAAAMAALLALGLALIDDRLYDPVDVERLALLPLLGVVPKAEQKKVKRG